MTRIGLISDTHASVHPRVLSFLAECDQIWHAGDIGNKETLDILSAIKPVVAVYGNIDDYGLRTILPSSICFRCEESNIWMTHIGGYPGRYAKGVEAYIRKVKPNVFICGHSHILKIMRDAKNNCLYINPGAAGRSGFHKNITAVRFTVDKKEFKNLEVLDIER